MKRAYLPILHTFFAAVVCLLTLVATGQESVSSVASKGAKALARQYLGTIEKTVSFHINAVGREDIIFVGQSLNPPHGWRIIAIADQDKPWIVWDSFTLHDAYLGVIGLSSINTEADGHNRYIVTLRGCVPHQCSDGKIGFALYASQSHRNYLAHVSMQEDNSYRVTYYPKAKIPNTYREKLDQMMCSDIGISRPPSLPIKCSAP